MLDTPPTVVACGWDTGRMDIADFIRARLAEDEQAATAVLGVNTVAGMWQGKPAPRWIASPADDGGITDTEGTPRVKFVWARERDHILRHDPAQIVADVAAKRRMIRLAFQHAAKIDGEWGCCHSAEQIEAGLCEYGPELELLQLLAAPYAAHPDYRPEWAPEDEE